jgi:pilus assembly protein TadC
LKVLKISKQAHHEVIGMPKLPRTLSQIFAKLPFYLLFARLPLRGRSSLLSLHVFPATKVDNKIFGTQAISRNSSTSAYVSVVLHPMRRGHNSHSSHMYKRLWKLPLVFNVGDGHVIFFSFLLLFFYLLFLFLFLFILFFFFNIIVLPPSPPPHRCGAEPIDLIIIILHGRALVGISRRHGEDFPWREI